MFKVRYGLGGGFGGVGEWEDCDCKTREDAEKYAYECAVEEYESYGGLHGLFDEQEYLEENPDATEDEVNDALQEDIESWIVYEVKNI